MSVQAFFFGPMESSAQTTRGTHAQRDTNIYNRDAKGVHLTQKASLIALRPAVAMCPTRSSPLFTLATKDVKLSSTISADAVCKASCSLPEGRLG
jgi:hypothetical protein